EISLELKILINYLKITVMIYLVFSYISRSNQYSQKGLNRLERLENIDTQFEINELSKIKYRRVLILDDVVTTGSSIHALKLKLEELGCQKIYATCLAYADN
ncbi:hypothetical protein M0D70_07615, partial [Acinetobacter portensis]